MNNYLSISLWLVLFYDALIMLALPSTAMYVAGTDGGVSRFICYSVAAALTGYILLNFGFKKLPIIWMGLLLVFIVFSSLHTPNIHFDGPFTPKDAGLFNYKPMFECFLMFGLFMAIYTVPISVIELKNIFKTLGYIGILISIYIILQRLGMDQIYRLTDEMAFNHLSRNPEVGGFISQPVYASALLVILLPFMYRLSGWLALLGIGSILLTGNRSGLIAVVIMTAYFLTGSSRVGLTAFVVYMVILAIVEGIYWVHPQGMQQLFNPDGRLEAWKMIVQDFISPKFPGIDKSYVITGQGIGAFSMIFPFYNQSGFNQAHNEYLELWRGTSFIGLFLFFKMQFSILNQTENVLIFASLLGISIFACTNPVWHITTLAFMTVFIAGLGLNKLERA